MICVEWLSHLIDIAVGEGSWKPMRVGRQRPLISRLLIADDLLLIAEASTT